MYTYVQPSSVKRQRGEVTSRGVDACFRHLLGGWIPTNQKVIELVRKSVDDGSYRKDRELVISHIKSDLALCAYLFRHLASLREKVGPIQDPLGEVREIKIERLEQFLSLACGTLSARVFKDIGPSQARSVRETFVTCAAAETMSAQVSIPADVGYSAGFLQRIGALLVSWNYPRLFSHASSSVRTHGGTVSERLAQVLGVSLEEIGVRCARDWKFSDDLKLSVGSPDDHRVGFVSETSRKLREVTECAETLAQTEEGECYPDAQARWDALLTRVNPKIVEGGRSALRAKVWKSLMHVRELMPEKMAALATPPSERVQVRSVGNRLFEANSYAVRCHPELRAHFERTYGLMREGEVSIEALNVLSSEVIPFAGFTNGCAWRFFADRNALVPLLRFGSRPLEAYESVSVPTMRPVAEAVYSAVPQRLTGSIFSNEDVSFVAGAMGSLEQQGLLYLEERPYDQSSDPLDSLLHFKAVRRCLVDCLQLR